MGSRFTQVEHKKNYDECDQNSDQDRQYRRECPRLIDDVVECSTKRTGRRRPSSDDRECGTQPVKMEDEVSTGLELGTHRDEMSFLGSTSACFAPTPALRPIRQPAGARRAAPALRGYPDFALAPAAAALESVGARVSMG